MYAYVRLAAIHVTTLEEDGGRLAQFLFTSRSEAAPPEPGGGLAG